MTFEYCKNLALERGENEKLSDMYANRCLSECALMLDEIRQYGDNGIDPEKWSMKESFVFIEAYKKTLHAGHSEEFAKAYADKFNLADGEYEAIDAGFKKIREISNDNSSIIKEAILVCKLKGKTEKYIEIYVENILIEGNSKLAEVFAENYEQAYLKCKKENKSELYSKLFSELVTYDDRNEDYANFYVSEYEKLIMDGNDEQYAKIYSDIFAHAAINALYKGGKNAVEDNASFFEDKAYSYAEAYFYALQNNIASPEEFAETFDMIGFGNHDPRDKVANLVQLEKIATTFIKTN